MHPLQRHQPLKHQLQQLQAVAIKIVLHLVAKIAGFHA
jgi:hypothetical protein